MIAAPASSKSRLILISAVLTCAMTLVACGGESDPGTSAALAKATPSTQASTKETSASSLRMRIDGVEWIAEHDLFGSVHPTGYDRSILMAGSRGGKDANEQAFNLNLFGIDGPGHYRVSGREPNKGLAQMANLSAERYLAGNTLGYDIEVDIVRYSKNPDRIEATFSGILNANDGSTVKIEEGRFNYRE